MPEFIKSAESNVENKEASIDNKALLDFQEFKDYYKNASEDQKNALTQKFNNYVNQEIKKDPTLDSTLNDKVIDKQESNDLVEIRQEDIDNIRTVTNLTDVLRDYPNVKSPEFKAIQKMIEDYTKELTQQTEELLANPEKDETKEITSKNSD